MKISRLPALQSFEQSDMGSHNTYGEAHIAGFSNLYAVGES